MVVAKISPEFQPRILAFSCQWCGYAGADHAGGQRLHYPATVHIVRLPCSGQISPQLILRAFQKGWDGVLICGCHPGSCHYGEGNSQGRRRLLLCRSLLEFQGLEPQRLQYQWVSAHEGAKFAAIIREMSGELQALGPNYKFRETFPPLDGDENA